MAPATQPMRPTTTRLGAYRQRGVTPQRILGLLGAMSGIIPPPAREASLDELLDRFDLAALSPNSIVLTAGHAASLSP